MTFPCHARLGANIFHIAQEMILAVQGLPEGTVLELDNFNGHKIRVGKRTTIASIFRQAGYTKDARAKKMLAYSIANEDRLPDDLPAEPSVVVITT